MNFGGIMLSGGEGSQSQKVTYYIIPFLQIFKNDRIIEMKNR